MAFLRLPANQLRVAIALGGALAGTGVAIGAGLGWLSGAQASSLPGGAEVTVASRRYVIRGGYPGRERLRVLGRVMADSTSALLARVRVRSDAWCLDVGCGGGDVTAVLAGLVADGFVIGTDIDQAVLELARAEAAEAGLRNVEFRHEDITRRHELERDFDIVYARFLLGHLADPGAALATLRARP